MPQTRATQQDNQISQLRGLPNGFQDALAIELKNPNGTSTLGTKQIEYHKNLKDKCNIKTIVRHNYEDIILEIHDHYKEVFARAPTIALADEPKQTFNFATNDNPSYWCNKLKNHTGLAESARREVYQKMSFT